METLLLQFVSTLDASLKKMQIEAGQSAGFSLLTISQFQYINAIYELGEPSITEISEKLKISKASVTVGINKLIRLGYVTKTRSTADKRVFHVCLTPASNELIHAKSRAIREYVGFIRSALTEEEARHFEQIIAKLVMVFHQK